MPQYIQFGESGTFMQLLTRVKGSARQGSVVDWAPTELQNGPKNGGEVSTPLPIKLHQRVIWIKTKMDGSVKSECSGALKNWTGLAWAAKSQ